jgi:DnaD/phage-associated family protein
MHELFRLEQFSRDSFRVKRTYIDICGDLVAGILLGQIVYWFMPNEHGKSKLRVWKDGELWLAKGRNDWWDEIRITAKQFDRAIKILEDKGFVETKKFKFNGAPTVHIKLNVEKVTEAVNSILTVGEDGFLPKGKIQITETGKTLTEITTEITTNVVEKVEQVYQSYQNENPHSMYEKLFGGLDGRIGEEINIWIDDLSEELVIEAMKMAKEKQKDWRYAKGILRSWAQQGITSLNDLEKQKEKKSAPRRRSQADVWNAFNNYINSLGDEEDE